MVLYMPMFILLACSQPWQRRLQKSAAEAAAQAQTVPAGCKLSYRERRCRSAAEDAARPQPPRITAADAVGSCGGQDPGRGRC